MLAHQIIQENQKQFFMKLRKLSIYKIDKRQYEMGIRVEIAAGFCQEIAGPEPFKHVLAKNW